MATSKRLLPLALLLLLSLSLTTSRAFAWEINKTGSGRDIKWSNGNASYFINPASGPAGAIDAVQSGMQTWSVVPSAKFAFSGSQSSANCTEASGGPNGICFGPVNQKGVVAQNTFWYDPSSGEMLHSEIVFNTNYQWSINGTATSFDVQEIITHELGHTLSLKDEYQPAQSENTMYGYAAYNETKKRSLEADDIAGISYLYPGDSTTTTPAPTPTPAPSTCTYSVRLSANKFDAAGGSGTATVTTQSGCTWSAASTVPWIAMGSVAATTVPFTVAANTANTLRMASITVANKSLIITQAAAVSASTPIAITANPTTLDFGTIAHAGKTTKSTVVKVTGSGIQTIMAYLSGPNWSSFPSTMTKVRNSSTSYTLTITTTFAPRTVGAKTGSLDIYVNNGKSKLSIPLSGTGS